MKITSTITKALVLCMLSIFSISMSWARTVTTIDKVTENLVLSEAVEYHITATENCIAEGVTINITSEDAWVIFDNLRPSQVIQTWLSKIQINGAAAVSKKNTWVNIWANGAAIVPHSPKFEALTCYTGELYSGDAKGYACGEYTNLGLAFDNKFKSFKLKRGYMAIVAQGKNSGSGYSRCFIAQDDDIEIPNLADPQACTRGGALYERISYIRVMRWQAPTKKSAIGYSSGYMTDRSWEYNYAASDTENSDKEFVNMLHHVGWDNGAYDTPRSSTSGNTTTLFFNEPWNTADGEGKLNSVDEAFNYYPNLLKNGSRMGSMGPQMGKEPKLREFLTKCDERGMRVDVIALHIYQWQGGNWWKSQAESWYKSYQRPVWITEWNIGPWPKHPDWATGTPEERGWVLEQTRDRMREVLTALEESPYVERYALFNFSGFSDINIVQDSEEPYTAIVDGVERTFNKGDLLPAGEVYQNFPSKMAYNAKYAHIPPYPTFTEPSLAFNTNGLASAGQVRVICSDDNGEYFDSVLVEKKIGEGAWQYCASGSKLPGTGFIDKWDMENPQPTSYRVSFFYCEESTPRFTKEESVDMSVAINAPIIHGTAQISKPEAATVLFKEYESGGSLPIIGAAQRAKLFQEINQFVPVIEESSRRGTYQLQAIPWGYLFNYDKDRLSALVFEESTEVPYMVIDSTLTQLQEGLPIESGQLQRISNQWVTVTFKTPFETTPVVIPTVTTKNNFNSNVSPVVPRLRNVTPTGFEICLTRESALAEKAWAAIGEKVTYVAIPQGDFTIKYEQDGKDCNLRILSSLVEQDISTTMRNVNFETPFEGIPTFFAALQTSNDDLTCTFSYTNLTESSVRWQRTQEKSSTISRLEKDYAGYIALYNTVPKSGVGIEEVTISGNSDALKLHIAGNRLRVESEGETRFSLYDSAGNLVLQAPASEDIDISFLSSGTYIVRSEQGASAKFVKE